MVYKITCNVKNRNPIEKKLLQLRERLLSFLKKDRIFAFSPLFQCHYSLFFSMANIVKGGNRMTRQKGLVWDQSPSIISMDKRKN